MASRLAIQHALKQSTQCGKLVAVRQCVYCLSEKTMSLCALCSSAAASVAVCQLQFQPSHYRLFAPRNVTSEGASEKNFLGSLSLAISYGPLINYSIIRPLGLGRFMIWGQAG